MAAASRFVEISKEFFDILLDDSVPEKTKKATKYRYLMVNIFFYLTKLFYKFKTNPALLSLISVSSILSPFYYRMVCKPNKI